MLWQPLIKTINSALSNLIEQESHMNYKKTQQGVPDILLPYLYYRYMIYGGNK